MRLIVLHSEAMIADVICGQERVHIGSGQECQVQLPDSRIAPQQVAVYPEGDGWVIEQLDTACPVHVNQTTVAAKVDLKAGDEIQILEYAVRVFPDYEERAAGKVTVGTSRAQLERFAQSKLPAGAILKRPDEALTLQPAQLAALGRTSVSVSAASTIEELMEAALQVLLLNFAAQRAWIGVRRLGYGPLEYVEGRSIAGQVIDLPEPGQQLKPRVLDRAQFILVPMVSRQERISFLAGPLVGPDGILGMVYVDSGDSGRRFDARDLDIFVALAASAAHHLDAISKTISRNRAALIEGQVSLAHEVQARLTPRKLPQTDELQFGAFRETGRDRAGDIYDVVRLPNNQVALTVTHTPATGVMPSLLMIQALTTFRISGMHQEPPHTFLRQLNWILHDGQKDHPLFCFAGVIDPPTGQMQYALAGPLGAFVISARGEERTLTPAEPPPALGFEKSTVYPLLTEQLEPGETLVVFTPGVTTATSKSGETFGQDRFINILCDGFGQLASATLKEMLSDLRSFTEGGSQPDDITVLLAHRV